MAPNGTADLAFVNGRVATMDAVRRWAGAVAVSTGSRSWRSGPTAMWAS